MDFYLSRFVFSTGRFWAAILCLTLTGSVALAQAPASQTLHVGSIQLEDGNGHTTTIQAPNTNTTFTPPGNTPSAGEVIASDGSGGTTWSAPTSGVVSGSVVGFTSSDAITGYTYTGNSQVLNTTSAWTTPTTTGTFTGRLGPAAAALNGKVYVYGGWVSPNVLSTLEVFDPATNSWTSPTTTGTPTPRYGAGAAVVNNLIYFVGGTTGTTIDVFDPSTNTWTSPTTSGTFTPRSFLGVVPVNGKIYALGGLTGTGTTSALEVYDPTTTTWSTPTATGTWSKRSDFGASAVNGKIYAIGGINSSYVTAVDVFDPSTNSWTTPSTSGTFTSREDLTATTVNGLIYALGGYNYPMGGAVNTAEVFDPATSTWSTLSATGAMSQRALHSAALLDGHIYLVGGEDRLSFPTSLDELTPPFSIYYFTKN